MATHLEQTIKACSKALDEAKKMEKQFKATKNPQEKEKLQKMAAGARKIAEAFYNSIDAAKEKDRQEILGIFKAMGV